MTEDDLITLVKSEVPLAWFREGIRVVASAQRQILGRTQRWDWTIAKLMQTLLIPRSVAELLAALGLRWVKTHGVPEDDQP